jgi:hypothetical protein
MEPHRLALPPGFRIENYEIQTTLDKARVLSITILLFTVTPPKRLVGMGSLRLKALLMS